MQQAGDEATPFKEDAVKTGQVASEQVFEVSGGALLKSKYS